MVAAAASAAVMVAVAQVVLVIAGAEDGGGDALEGVGHPATTASVATATTAAYHRIGRPVPGAGARPATVVASLVPVVPRVAAAAVRLGPFGTRGPHREDRRRVVEKAHPILLFDCCSCCCCSCCCFCGWHDVQAASEPFFLEVQGEEKVRFQVGRGMRW